MGLNFKQWLMSKLESGKEKVDDIAVSGQEFLELAGDIYVRELAFWSCVNLMSAALCKCEIKTYVDGKETKGQEYYTWNVAPNQNQNASMFKHKLAAKLYRDNEALVVEQNGGLYVADSFAKKEYALYDDQFAGVTVGNFTFEQTFYQSDVLYLQLSEQNVRCLVNGLYEQYNKLITYGMKSYRKTRGSRGVLNISAMAQGKPDFQETFQKLMNERFKTFFAAENAVVPLFDGYDYTDLGSKTYNNETTRDIKAMIDDVSEFTAKGFGIPPAMITGEVEGTKDAMEQFLSFPVGMLCKLLQEEINRKRYGYSGFAAGSGVTIDTKGIRHVDMFGMSTAIDKLISSGAYCVNDIRRAMGEELIEEPWAYQHFMTKNYATLESLLQAMKGGENI